MTLKIKQLPNYERPYEKFEMYGEKYLSNAELLAIIIKTGTKEKSAIELANEILNLENEKNNLTFLQDISIEELTKVKGIGKIKAIQLKAMCEFAKRMSRPFNFANKKIKCANDIVEFVMPELEYEKREILKVILLNSKNVIQKIVDVATGGVSSINIEVKTIFQETIKLGTPKIILVHNHPSGDPTPSNADYEFTQNVDYAAKLLGIELLDHIVIGKNKYESITLNLRNK